MPTLTTITLRNNAQGDILKEENAKEVIDNLRLALSGQAPSELPVGSFGNAMIVQKPAWSDVTTLYLHCGNTVICMDDVDENTDVFIDRAIWEMRRQIKRLKAEKAKLKETTK